MKHQTKALTIASQMLRPQHQQFQHLHPAFVNKLINKTKEPQPLKYKMHPVISPQVLKLPHSKPLGTLQKLPFHVSRTHVGNLPVYTQFKNQHVIKRTIVRLITGDVIKMAEQLEKIVSGAEVRIKVGKVQIPGIHKQSIEMWLLRLGL